MPFILSGNVGSATAATGFNVTNSVMFEQADDPYFEKTPTGDGHQRTFTFSVWLKMDLHDSGDTHKIFDTGSSTNYFTIFVTEDPFLRIIGRVSNSNVLDLITTKAFRDPSAWFHLYVAIDTTQGTAANRAKIYINGSQVTSFGTETYPNQNTDFEIQDANYPFRLGADKGLGDEHYDGYMAEYMFVDGAAQAIGDFGEFDEDSPTIWKPKDISAIDVNPANDNGNGFYLDFKDSSNLGNDVGVNAGTDFSENNITARDQATDTCTNNFCTLNPLWRSYFYNDGTMSQGNCRGSFTADNANRGYLMTTMGVSAGKWYWEAKVIDNTRMYIGIAKQSVMGVNEPFYDATTYNAVAINNSGEVYGRWTGSAIDQFDTSVSTADNDILGFALDRDNKELYIHKNGTYMNSGDPTSGSSRTGGLIDELTASRDLYIPGNDFIFPFMHDPSNSGKLDIEWNFGGCPAFAISSSNADGNGFGNFEYAVPSGFFALCTKNLGSDGG